MCWECVCVCVCFFPFIFGCLHSIDISIDSQHIGVSALTYVLVFSFNRYTGIRLLSGTDSINPRTRKKAHRQMNGIKSERETERGDGRRGNHPVRPNKILCAIKERKKADIIHSCFGELFTNFKVVYFPSSRNKQPSD